jgi:aminoglycoside phosphotransferase (APT) family kinase protein
VTLDASQRTAVERALASALDRDLRIVSAQLLTGGTLQENIRIDTCDNEGGEPRSYVVRVTGPTTVTGALSRREEFEVMKAVESSGANVARPVCFLPGGGAFERDAFIMTYVAGDPSPRRLTRGTQWAGAAGEALLERIGEQLGFIQRVTPKTSPLTLRRSGQDPTGELISSFRTSLRDGDTPRPALDWLVTWLSDNRPTDCPLVLTHNDFRVGNFLVDDLGAPTFLDWELAGWGHPLQDVGFFCIRFWRFGQDDRAAGGIGNRNHFYRGYERTSGHLVDADAVRYWEVFGNVRWAIISIQQAQRHFDGSTPSLEFALTGRCTAEMEYEALRLLREYVDAR